MSQRAGRGRKKAQLRSETQFPSRDSPPGKTGWDSARRKLCIVCVVVVVVEIIKSTLVQRALFSN